MGKYKILDNNNNYHMEKYSGLNLKQILSCSVSNSSSSYIIGYYTSLISNGIHLLSVMNIIEVKR